MLVKIIGDSANKYNGFFKAEFNIDGKLYFLSYDLERWRGPHTNGFFGGGYVQVLDPNPMNLYFDKEYEVDLETARRIYATLVEHDWQPITPLGEKNEF